jgi:hypothetical protein
VDKAKRLIAAGYLPKELTPEFTAIPLSRSYKNVVAAFSKPTSPWSSPAPFSLARGGHARRALKTPNPVNYIRQATIVDRHWKAIRSVCVPDKLSLTTPLFRAPRKGRNRATNVGPVQDLPRRRLAALAANRYVLQTDFAQYYRSIYTHAVPWGILGKKKAKANFEKKIRTFADDLDRAIREGQEGQTMGIPVGPDISHILSEVIAARVDRTAFRSGVPEGFRHADDYFLCFRTEPEASRALDRLADAARSFELDLNYDKTSITQIKDLTDSIGLDPLSDFFSSSTGSVSERSCITFSR